ncbi:ImpA family type VI secretion system protein [Variovorax sp. CT11-76]
MSQAEIELLQKPVEGPLPCGEDLEYDADFMALQQATLGKREQQFGNTIIPAEPPDWTKVERIAKQLCERTRDLRVLVPLTLAWTESRGLPGYVEGLQLVDVVLQTFWDDVHPRVVDGGDEDPLPRMNALAALAESEGIGRSVRDARLLDDGGVTMTLRQVEALLDSSKADQIDYPGGVGRLRTVAQLLPEKALQSALEAPQTAHQSPSASDAVAPAASPVAAATVASGGPGLRAIGINDIEITSREDVQVLLEKACRYLERAEPSHPAPLLIRRAQKLLALNFFQIIEELMPEGLQKLESLAGRPPGTDASQ